MYVMKCNEMLLNAAKCQGYSFHRFWVIKERPIRVKTFLLISLVNTRLNLTNCWLICTVYQG